ncbi:MAG TPA: hypothetical protein VD862_02510 [Candidatus Paceibacterota bacterium]|nr:hypothetical protein [Candidatus Paceibacterota bacterium]
MEETPQNGGIALPGGKRLVLGLAAGIIVVAGVAGYFWYEARSLKGDPDRAARQEVQELVAQVSKLIVLPDDEEPVIATVADPSQLADQPFFAKAKVGDKVLIYNNARKAVLYNPTEHRIVEVAPLNIGDAQ